jgi:hypothetical protein
LVGGLVMGVLSALPIVSLGNACCCLWVLSGGAVAAYLLQQEATGPITPGDGALVGLLAGLCGAVVEVIVSIPITIVVGPMERALIERAVDMAGSMPPEMRDALERVRGGGMAGGAFFVASRAAALILWLCVGAIFSTLGGLIGAAIFRKPASPGTSDIPPTSV